MIKIKKYTLEQLSKVNPKLGENELKTLIGGNQYVPGNYGITEYDDSGNFIGFNAYNGESYGSFSFSSSGSGSSSFWGSGSSSDSGSSSFWGSGSPYGAEQSLLSQLTADQLYFLDSNNISIKREDISDASSYYNKYNNGIYLKNSYDTSENETTSFNHELLHSYQYCMNMVDNRSCMEFQTYLVQDLKACVRRGGASPSVNSASDYGLWILNLLGEHLESRTIDKEKFLETYKSYYSQFYDLNKTNPKIIGGPKDLNYDYHWETVFEFLGFKFK